MAKTKAQQNRAIRQEELRAKLAAGGHLQQVVKNITKIEKLKPSDTFTQELAKHKVAAELQMRLVSKYLPDLKAIEHTGEGGGSIDHEHWIENLE